MVTILKAADIVISRAGSLSLSEIFASGIAPILVPYPHAAADHQRKNAKFVQEHNACIYIEDEDADPNYFLQLLIELKNDTNKIKDLKSNASKLCKYDALTNIVEQFERVSS
jgi:UDP-N-acetylglucosamine--N-acetylmuramyl-(pentapeptide) pyrophosphoryl-undecaprenol N-acetylglucosamine transferase